MKKAELNVQLEPKPPPTRSAVTLNIAGRKYGRLYLEWKEFNILNQISGCENVTLTLFAHMEHLYLARTTRQFCQAVPGGWGWGAGGVGTLDLLAPIRSYMLVHALTTFSDRNGNDVRMNQWLQLLAHLKF